ncbi:SGNH/GDSL hydrolase family protein [Microvenator marinus]|uniref:SGNH/GDSL hydrolase family protein n=1 Tax=Microvenator marinus TaxID=2600177 RepID=A0A5B8XPM2_9DELT|nr:SGNH/GDSL hydrolase family protein [Microvenator marinus]QED26898.1 SGNH/GDSL hydrolase family protein [Microvenator marinus]
MSLLFRSTLTGLCGSLLLLSACGDDSSSPNEQVSTTNNATNSQTIPEEARALLPCDSDEEASFIGSNYVDSGDLADSEYAHSAEEQRGPGEPTTVRIMTQDQVFVEDSCEDGSFRVSEELQHPYMVWIETENEITSRNLARFTPEALEDGTFDILVFGDSIPVFGPTPYFPNILRDKFQRFGEVTLENVAVSGSTSVEWIPGAVHFENRLSPNLGEADLIVFSLGGNDLQDFAFEIDPNNVAAKIGELPALIDEIEANLKLTIAEVRAQNPDADIVWLVYPNYARSTEWEAFIPPQNKELAVRFLDSTLSDVRKRMANEDILLLDMLGATAEENLDTFLVDPLHLNVEGHQFWADELFRLLGGVEGPEPLERQWALSP